MSYALYRRYRPDSFADVIGQEHVTGPLQQALRNDRTNHAYLFSGPRGCGKTTSARILARCLNCEAGPTPQPCGECRSCRDLARGGVGSIDVIEIDAASHNGVDDARELRERAFYAPAASRYKVYIIDEAHMVTPQAFNALLKLVEEPPDFVKFIFATTEPEKVLGTIRSRTHHYPFRLVPPGVLQQHLTSIAEQEGIIVEPGVLPLVVRAGAGSVRDAMSVLDQLAGGAADDGVTYAMATALLGYTDATLIDDVVDAFAASDGARVFEVVDRVIEAGYDPRRFLADLLERLRDLVVVDAIPDAFQRGLVTAPADQAERMAAQAGRFGTASLARAADLVNQGLTDLRGATAPRLHLELVCAKVLLPGAHLDEGGLADRLERLERRLAIGGVAQRDAQRPAPAREPALEPVREPTPEPAPPPASEPTRTRRAEPARTDPAASEPTQQAQASPSAGEPGAPAALGTTTTGTATQGAGAEAPTARPAGQVDLSQVRRLWPEVLERVKGIRRVTWMLLFEKSSIVGVDGGRLTLALRDVGAVKAFPASGHDEVVRQALIDVLGLDLRIEAVADPGAAGRAARPASSAVGPVPEPPPAEPPLAAGGSGPAPSPDDPDAHVDVTDPDVDASLVGHDLVIQQLGGRVIGEIDHQ